MPELERTWHASLMDTCVKIGRHMNHLQQVHQYDKTCKKVQPESHYNNPVPMPPHLTRKIIIARGKRGGGNLLHTPL